jgi:hypothetical protein
MNLPRRMSGNSRVLPQIEERGYAKPYLADDCEIIKLGVSFSSETRTIEEWERGK